jgi:hypothetical protein
MCITEGASAAMVVAGIGAMVVTARRGLPAAVPATLGYFAAMEALQVAGYRVIDQCGTPANEAVTLLSILHIVFQPLVVNAFAMSLVAGGVQPRTQALVYGTCLLSAFVMLMQIYPFEWAGACRPGDALCGAVLCTTSGDWHLAWTVPFNGLLVPFDDALGTRFAFPTYFIAVFLIPIAYGAWRFALLHFVIGPALATLLTSEPNEVPAIWCLFSIAIALIALSPWLWRRFEVRAPTPSS